MPVKDEDVKKVQAGREKNAQLRKQIQWEAPARGPEYGYAIPLSNPTGAIATLGTALAALPIVSDPQGAYETAQGAMNSVGSAIKSGLEKVKGLLPGSKSSSQGSAPAPPPEDNGDWYDKYSRKGWRPGAGYRQGVTAGRVLRDAAYANWGIPIAEKILSNTPAGAWGLAGKVFGGDKPVERNDATYNLPEGFVPIAGQNGQGQVVVPSQSGRPDSVVTLSKRPDTSGMYDN